MRKTILSLFLGLMLLPIGISQVFAEENKIIKDGSFQLEGVAEQQVIIAFAVSAGSIFAITVIFKRLSKKPLGDIILNSKGLPTLSKFQFLLWTIVIAFSYLAIQIITIIGTDYSGSYLLGDIPENLLALMGISVAVPIINSKIGEVEKSRNERFFGTMFYNPEGNLDLARLQMFLWTIIGISLFLYTVFDQVWTLEEVEKLFLPDVSPTLLILMGLSQTAYLGSKMAKKDPQSTPTNPPPVKDDE